MLSFLFTTKVTKKQRDAKGNACCDPDIYHNGTEAQSFCLLQWKCESAESAGEEILTAKGTKKQRSAKGNGCCGSDIYHNGTEAQRL